MCVRLKIGLFLGNKDVSKLLQAQFQKIAQELFLGKKGALKIEACSFHLPAVCRSSSVLANCQNNKKHTSKTEDILQPIPLTPAFGTVPTHKESRCGFKKKVVETSEENPEAQNP